jgi:hypothetical protein
MNKIVRKQFSVFKGKLPAGVTRPANGDIVILSAEIPAEDEGGGDIVRIAGMDVPDCIPLQAQHLKYAPDGSPTTIGKVSKTYDSQIEWKGKNVAAKLGAIEWAPTELANKYKALWPEFINSVSIGAFIKKADPLDPKKPMLGWDIKESEVFELSIVTIPANPAAKVLRAIKDMFGDELDADPLSLDIATSLKSILSRLDDLESLIVAKAEPAAQQPSDPDPVQKDDELLGRLIDALRKA